jgi:hypothetical protein
MIFTTAELSKGRSTLIFGCRRRQCPDFGKDAAQGGARSVSSCAGSNTSGLRVCLHQRLALGGIDNEEVSVYGLVGQLTYSGSPCTARQEEQVRAVG